MDHRTADAEAPAPEALDPALQAEQIRLLFRLLVGYLGDAAGHFHPRSTSEHLSHPALFIWFVCIAP
jgi:hypothetical protein